MFQLSNISKHCRNPAMHWDAPFCKKIIKRQSNFKLYTHPDFQTHHPHLLRHVNDHVCGRDWLFVVWANMGIIPVEYLYWVGG